MVLGIPGGRGLFSQMQAALSASQNQKWVYLSQAATDQLADFQQLATDLCLRPTRIAELIPSYPTFLGTCDASQLGLGGVWLPPDHVANTTTNHPPIVWRFPIPRALVPLITTPDNAGSITINDLELAASLAHADVLAHCVDFRERTLATFSDNQSAISCHHKGSRTTTGPSAYLLRVTSLHQRKWRYKHSAFKIDQ